MPEQLLECGFTTRDSLIFSLAVAVTRGMSIPDVWSVSTLCSSSVALDDDLADAMTVVFMFNVVNRVANAFDIVPELGSFGRDGLGRRIAQWVSSRGLLWHMPLEPSATSARQEPERDLSVPARQLGLQGACLEGLWNELDYIPSIRTAVYQLFWSSLMCSELDSATLRSCVEHVTSPVEEMHRFIGDELRAFCSGLFHHPYQFPFADFTATRLQVTEEQKVEIVFRIALAAATLKMSHFFDALQRPA